ncbi:hypothetical protein [Vibrio comitans]|uniref:Uncharacterized protein n=1 Tax=Vibrio comitans NBRC 102076 TaxID=1219078 RepID=A0A4Y3IKY7_9VIBR|nr:hypothetical protein [Vibrio comitans]GEA60017.1 hypothetical protein VCO01S_12100 [Vibrio comitans NBRC 102076]
MYKLASKISAISLFACFVGTVSAEEPNVPTEAPYIVLSDNLDEPNGYGFCLDTYGPGQSELMQTHSCKPKTKAGTPKNDPGHDVRFAYDPETKKVSSYAFDNQCMQVLTAVGKSEFALLECSDHPHQKFIYNQEDNTLRLDKDQNYCVVVDSITQEAGPWVKRPLQLAECSEIESSRKQWSVISM